MLGPAADPPVAVSEPSTSARLPLVPAGGSPLSRSTVWLLDAVPPLLLLDRRHLDAVLFADRHHGPGQDSGVGFDVYRRLAR